MKKKFLMMVIGMMIAITACVNNNGSDSSTANTNESDDMDEYTDEMSEPQDDAMTFTVNSVSFKMIKVEGGTFEMGATREQRFDACYDEKPVHCVELSDYYIGETEVTQELWQAVMGSLPEDMYEKSWDIIGAWRPVCCVSWNDSQDFVLELNAQTGQNFRLPTEAEWEYAARGGRKSNFTKYSGSRYIDDVAWYEDNSEGGTHNVKTKAANELGIYDMSGNVEEWCQDIYGDYSSEYQYNPINDYGSASRVLRGGDFRSEGCRVSSRDRSLSATGLVFYGLRLAL